MGHHNLATRLFAAQQNMRHCQHDRRYRRPLTSRVAAKQSRLLPTLAATWMRSLLLIAPDCDWGSGDTAP